MHLIAVGDGEPGFGDAQQIAAHRRFRQDPKSNWLRSVVVELFADGGPAARLVPDRSALPR